MTGPEHYREAERLASEAMSSRFTGYGRENHLAAAQVHATLALAAATANSSSLTSWTEDNADNRREWSEVTA